jgi:hypothetical protein
MTPALVIVLTVAALSGAYLGEWVVAHRDGNRWRARAARNGLAAHLAFSTAFFVVLGVAP